MKNNRTAALGRRGRQRVASPFAIPLRTALSRFASGRTALSETKGLTVNSAKGLMVNSASRVRGSQRAIFEADWHRFVGRSLPVWFGFVQLTTDD